MPQPARVLVVNDDPDILEIVARALESAGHAVSRCPDHDAAVGAIAVAAPDIVEASANGTKGMCCGAGGARMWMEETIGTKVNDARSRELIATGASRIATACPFCYIMIDDGVKGLGKEEDEVKVADIAMHLLEAIEKGEAGRQPGQLETVED